MLLLVLGVICALLIVFFIIKRKGRIIIKPITILSRDFKEYTVKDLKDIIEKKLSSEEITEKTKLFSHVYTEDGEAVEFPDICIDTIDGLDFDIDGRELIKYVLKKHKEENDLINEEQLDELAKDYCKSLPYPENDKRYYAAKEDFKAGYRKAKEI